MTKTQDDPNIRILKTASCRSLSDKSKLTYQIGCKDKSDVWFRVTHNSSSGSFNDSWVSWRAIQELFLKNPRGEAMTAWILSPLFRGKSQNSPFFLFAALRNEGLVTLSKDVRRCYEPVDPKMFLARISALAEGKKSEQGAARKSMRKPTGTSKKAAAKK